VSHRIAAGHAEQRRNFVLTAFSVVPSTAQSPDTVGRRPNGGMQRGRDAIFEQEWEDYVPRFERIVSVDLPLCLKAVELRRAATARLPTIDSLIAAAAVEYDADLVHRDPHFASIPGHLLKQEVLPEK
jgi:PIN domain